MFDDLTSWHWFSFVLGNVWTYAVYKQLFGYGVWETLWRVVLALVCAHLLALLFLGIDFIYHLIQTGDYNFVDGFKLFIKLLNRMLTNSDYRPRSCHLLFIASVIALRMGNQIPSVRPLNKKFCLISQPL